MGRPPFDGLGFDPTPGAPAQVADLAVKVRSAHGDVRESRAPLDGMLSDTTLWEGDAANGFRARLEEINPDLEKLENALNTCARELEVWADELTGYQRQADDLEARATTARNRGERAMDNPWLQRPPDSWYWFQAYPDDADRKEALEQGGIANWQAAVQEKEAAEDAFDALIAEGKKLQQDHHATAEAHAKLVQKAADDSPLKQGWFEGIVDDWSPGFLAIGDFMSNASSILGLAGVAVIAFGAFLGPGEAVAGPIGLALMGASSALSAGALAFHAAADAGGESIPADKYILDGMGALPVIGPGAKTAAAVLKGAEMTPKMATWIGVNIPSVVSSGLGFPGAVDYFKEKAGDLWDSLTGGSDNGYRPMYPMTGTNSAFTQASGGLKAAA
jgi:uncharacterized protein YukE